MDDIDFIVLIRNGERSAAAEAQTRNALVFHGKPKGLELLIVMVDLSLCDPDRWVLSWLAFDSTHGEVLVIHPDTTTVKEFVRHFRLNPENVAAATTVRSLFERCEIVILGVEFNARPDRCFLSLFLRIDQPLENSFDDPFASALGHNLEIFLSRSVICHLHDHFCSKRGGKALIVNFVDTFATIAFKGFGTLGILLDQLFNHLG